MEVSVRVHYVEGYAPSSLALDALNETILDVAGKRTVLQHQGSFPRQQSAQTNESLRKLAADLARLEPATDSPVIRLVYLNGVREPDEPWGLHIGNGTIVVFLDQLDGELALGVQVRGTGFNEFRDQSERSVLIHELGHAFGLVNCGLPMVEPREDPESQCHSTQGDSVMYPGVGHFTRDPVDAYAAGLDPIWRFNAADLEDIRAFQAMA